ncbi:MAG: isoprenylcysteine carboxylmethyltransferase family protein [Balneolaceae bacterium]|nr:isoprenylcysteine carboxylmethyltransferase family protein [Balneolaceae bacterium]
MDDLFCGRFQALVPTTINSGVAASWPQALFINIGLIILFGLQHTLMARKSFKEWWTNFIPKSIERSTYVLFSSVAILLLLWFWQPLNATIWAVEVTWAALILEWVFWLGWLIVFLSTWMIDHFNLFGIKQVYLHLKNKEQDPPELLEPGFYKFVRHPLMLGFLIAFWSTPLMTAGHLLFSAGMTIYILIGVYFEEKALIHRFGDDYKEYREKVPQFFPGLK